MNRSYIPALASLDERTEIKLRQTRLKRHQHCKQTSHPTVAVSKWVDKDQFSMHLGECGGDFQGIASVARRTPAKRLAVELRHQERNAGSVSEYETAFAEIDSPILSSPTVDGPQPEAVQLTYVDGAKSMRSLVPPGSLALNAL